MKKSKIESQLLILLREFVKELGSQRADRAIGLQANLESDLGLGSIERAEFFNRIERNFGIRLPESNLAAIKTIQDLIDPIQQANPPRSFRVDEFSPVVKEAESIPTKAKTLVTTLKHYVKYYPERPHVFLQDTYGIERTLTYGKLYKTAQAIANGLIKQGLKPDETVAIMLPTDESFFYAFFGILLAGGIPVPIYPPFRTDQIEAYVKREAIILRNAQVRLLITFHQAERLSKILRNFIPSLTAVKTCEALQTQGLKPTDVEITAESAAVIQYTSGSTSSPKGVLLSHQNILTNIRAYGKRLAITPMDIIVSWLPLYHDMGLIGAWLGSLYYGIPLVLLSPLTFLLHPERWLWAVHYHRATLSAGPNFAYELCVRRLNENALEGLDLSSWRVALNGAEAIYPSTLSRFIEKFAPYGFKAQAMSPAYGLAECSVALTAGTIGDKYRVDYVERDKFLKEQVAVSVTEDAPHAMAFVCCGKPLEGHEVRIVDEQSKPVADRCVGEIQFRGPSAMQGYYRNSKITQAQHHEGWWATGDYGYMTRDGLYVTGRKKDIIVKAGSNIYPEAAEALAAEVAGVREGCVAIFGVAEQTLGTESIIVVAETDEEHVRTQKQIQDQIKKKVFDVLGFSPEKVILVLPKIIPKTSSGKLQRSACKQAYLEGTLTKGEIPVWAQFTKIFFSSINKKLKQWAEKSARIIYGVYVGLILLVTLPFIWALVMILPKNLAVKLTKYYAALLLLFSACPTKVVGRENLVNKPPLIFVANHASYLDTLVLLTVLPTNVAFIAKQELLKSFVLRTFIKKLNHITVDRLDFSKRVKDIERIQKLLEQSRSILIFPEGTFTYATGLRPFRLGAFKLAVDLHLPICPIAIKGTRKILRSGSILPRLGKIKVTVLEPIQPREAGVQEMSRLSAAARVAIAEHCGESALDLIVAGYQEAP